MRKWWELSPLCCFSIVQKPRAQKPQPATGQLTPPSPSSSSHTTGILISTAAAALKTMQESDAIVSSYHNKDGKWLCIKYNGKE